jgi:hypothetical protein
LRGASEKNNESAEKVRSWDNDRELWKFGAGIWENGFSVSSTFRF